MNSVETIGPTRLNLLQALVQEKLNGQIRDLKLLHEEGGIVLHGIVPTFHAKQLAQHVLMAETDVPILANEIEVY